MTDVPISTVMRPLNVVRRHRLGASHDLIFHGGVTFPDLTFINFYLGGAAAWQPADRTNIDQALAAAMSDAHLNNVMAQYFHAGTALTSTMAPSQILPDALPATVDKAAAEGLVGTIVAGGHLQGLNLTMTVCDLLLPPGTVLQDDGGASSLAGLGGYHGSVHVAGAGTVYYAVGVYSEHLAAGGDNGIPVFGDNWKNVVATFYHELNEARTDADVEEAIRTGNNGLLGWTSRQGEEIGDYPVFEAGNNLGQVFQEVPLANGQGTVPVQFMFSNAVHGPQGPVDAPLPSLI